MLIMAAVIKWMNLDSCMPRGSKDYEVNQLLCGKGVPCQDERLEKGSFSLKPYLANYVTFPKVYT